MNRHNRGLLGAVLASVVVGITLTTAPVAAAWTPPVRVVSGQFGVSEVVDSRNHIHIAAAGRGGVWYITDRSGSWVPRRILANPPNAAYGGTSIALDENDRVFIAAGLFPVNDAGDLGIWLVSDKGRPRGTFPSQPKHIPGSGASPTVKVSHGHLLIADVIGGCCLGDGTVQLHTNATGRWTVTKVGRGLNPALRVGADGRPRIVFESEGLTLGSYHPGIYYADGSSPQGPFSVAKIPHTKSHDRGPALALDDGDEPHVTWFHWDSVSPYQAYVWHDSTGWHGPMEFARDASESTAFELDTLGRPNLAFGGTALRHEVLIGEAWHQTTVADPANVAGLAMRRAFGGHVAITWSNRAGIWVSRN